MKIRYISILLAITLIGCNSEGAFNDIVVSNNDVDSDSDAINHSELVDIIINPHYSEIYVPTQYEALGRYSDGSIVDITSQVDWSTVTPDIAHFDSAGIATPSFIGTTQVVATMEGIVSDEVTLDVIDTQICGHILGNPLNDQSGGGINDVDRDNAAGKCLKIREIVDNGVTKWFTSTPSETLVDYLGYTQDNNSDNAGNTYGGLFDESGTYGPSGVKFAEFRQDGMFSSYNSQYDRWCDRLSWLKFAGQSNWKTASVLELVALKEYQKDPNSQGMYNRFGWPTQRAYWSNTVNGPKMFTVHLYNGVSHNDREPLTALYASCVSYQ
jgi:hypothetical protein